MVEDAHSKGELRQLLVAHHYVGLKTLILGRAHTREVDTILSFPIPLLQVAQMVRHHRYVCSPILQAYQCSHTY